MELIIAAVSENREKVIEETADVIYHLLVLLRSLSIDLSDVESVLKTRRTKSGLEEKASRKA